MNEYIIKGSIVTMSIPYKGSTVYTQFSIEDLPKVRKGTWRILRKPNGTLYVQGRLEGSNKTVLMHRYIMGNPSVVDHRDRNPLNNTRDNLRNTDSTTNVRNRTITNSNGQHGIHLQDNGKYRVQIRVGKSLKHVGYFTDINDAIQARKEAEHKYWS